MLGEWPCHFSFVGSKVQGSSPLPHVFNDHLQIQQHNASYVRTDNNCESRTASNIGEASFKQTLGHRSALSPRGISRPDSSETWTNDSFGDLVCLRRWRKRVSQLPCGVLILWRRAPLRWFLLMLRDAPMQPRATKGTDPAGCNEDFPRLLSSWIPLRSQPVRIADSPNA